MNVNQFSTENRWVVMSITGNQRHRQGMALWRMVINLASEILNMQ